MCAGVLRKFRPVPISVDVVEKWRVLYPARKDMEHSCEGPPIAVCFFLPSEQILGTLFKSSMTNERPWNFWTKSDQAHMSHLVSILRWKIGRRISLSKVNPLIFPGLIFWGLSPVPPKWINLTPKGSQTADLLEKSITCYWPLFKICLA